MQEECGVSILHYFGWPRYRVTYSSAATKWQHRTLERTDDIERASVAATHNVPQGSVGCVWEGKQLVFNAEFPADHLYIKGR